MSLVVSAHTMKALIKEQVVNFLDQGGVLNYEEDVHKLFAKSDVVFCFCGSFRPDNVKEFKAVVKMIDCKVIFDFYWETPISPTEEELMSKMSIYNAASYKHEDFFERYIDVVPDDPDVYNHEVYACDMPVKDLIKYYKGACLTLDNAKEDFEKHVKWLYTNVDNPEAW